VNIKTKPKLYAKQVTVNAAKIKMSEHANNVEIRSFHILAKCSTKKNSGAYIMWGTRGLGRICGCPP